MWFDCDDHDNWHISSAQAATATTTPTPVPTNSLIPPAASNTAGLPTPSTVVSDTEKSLSVVVVTNGNVMSSYAKTTITPADTNDTLNAVRPTVPITHVELTDISISTDRQMGADDDMVMWDGPAAMKQPTNDENLPLWLLPMIKYLRRVAVDTTWQNLIMKFIEFEKGSLPAGVCSFLLCFYSPQNPEQNG